MLDSIDTYIGSHPEPKRSDLIRLHDHFKNLFPGEAVSFFDGLDDSGKVVANPTLGYGKHIIQYASGATRETFKLGLSANKTGISVYLMGISDKTLLLRMFADRLGKAKVTGYCIRFSTLADIDVDVLVDSLTKLV
jgi:hypothetical protein